MESKIREVVFILDESGSMGGLESDTIGGFNALLEKQRKAESDGCEVYISTILFNSKSKILHDRERPHAIKPLDGDSYRPGGCTALLDAVGKAIDHIGKVHHYLRREDVPGSVLFVITTDGLENASREYRLPQVKRMINEHREKGWEFLFLGANIDAVETAESLGIDRRRATNFHNDSKGIRTNFRTLARAVSSYCESGSIDDSWLNEIENDFESR